MWRGYIPTVVDIWLICGECNLPTPKTIVAPHGDKSFYQFCSSFIATYINNAEYVNPLGHINVDSFVPYSVNYHVNVGFFQCKDALMLYYNI